ncbi:MAG TPA: AAA family ATPase [Candidatus Eisenbacteria bacterium]|nr:AAA family ATPase [Candidatus Eisenbacteria bacterium]
MTQPCLIVLTGAPGTGKTAILRSLALAHVPEPAREVLAEQRAMGGTGTAQSDPARFVELLLERSIEKHRAALERGQSVLFDRGIPDCVAYARHLGGDPEPCRKAAAIHRYHATVLVTRPWAEIYSTDDERTMSFEATLPFQRLLEDAYEEAGYELIEVPRGSIAERGAFVRRFVGTEAEGGRGGIGQKTP